MNDRCTGWLKLHFRIYFQYTAQTNVLQIYVIECFVTGISRGIIEISSYDIGTVPLTPLTIAYALDGHQSYVDPHSFCQHDYAIQLAQVKMQQCFL